MHISTIIVGYPSGPHVGAGIVIDNGVWINSRNSAVDFCSLQNCMPQGEGK